MHKHRHLFNILIFLPYLLVLYILQASVCPHISLFGAKPLIIPLAVVGAALFGGRDMGALMGMLMGILLDLSFNNPPIVFMLTLTAAGLVIGYLIEKIIVRGFPSFFILSILTLALCSFVELFAPLFFNGQPAHALFDTAWRQIASSAVFTIPLYYLSRFVAHLT